MIHSMYIQCSWEQQWATCTDSRTTDPFQLLEVESSTAERCFQELCALNFPKALTMSSDAQLEQLFCFLRLTVLCACVCVRLCFFVRIWDPAGMSLDANGSSYPSKGCSQVALDRPQLTWTQVFDPGWDGGISKAKTGGFLVRDEGNTMEYSHYLTFL